MNNEKAPIVFATQLPANNQAPSSSEQKEEEEEEQQQQQQSPAEAVTCSCILPLGHEAHTYPRIYKNIMHHA